MRDVDYCSAAFLLARAAPLHELGGFDEAFAPGYYEDADLCLALAASGHRVVYDPAVVVRHLEHGTSDGVAAAAAMIAAHRDVFFRKHRARLRFRYPADARAALFARSSVPSRGRVLFIEDQVPLRRLGQGFVRSNDIVAALAASGRQVTVYPLHPARVDPAAIYADLGETVEVMHERGLDALEAFLKARRGYYDTIWIARTHNLDRVKPILERGGTDVVGGVRIVLDTEAIGALREAARREVMGEPPLDVDAAMAEEFAAAWFCQAVVAVSEAEAARLRALGFTDVAVLGHARAATPTPRPFEERAGMLFVGALAVEGSPNHDGLLWFVDEVLPLIEAALGYETRLTVVGHVGDVDLSRLEEHPRVTLRREVADLVPVYDRHRVFVAPTRFAAGIPYKVHEAASMGVPVVATSLLAGQLGWQDGRELMAVPVGDAEGFARAVLAVYRDAEVWGALREAALARVAAECGTEGFRAAVEGVVGGPVTQGLRAVEQSCDEFGADPGARRRLVHIGTEGIARSASAGRLLRDRNRHRRYVGARGLRLDRRRSGTSGHARCCRQEAGLLPVPTHERRFFARHDLGGLLGKPISMAFLDGMHHFEYLLRDFINTEKHCSSNSVILLHDCLPTDRHVARRESRTIIPRG